MIDVKLDRALERDYDAVKDLVQASLFHQGDRGINARHQMRVRFPLVRRVASEDFGLFLHDGTEFIRYLGQASPEYNQLWNRRREVNFY